MVIVKLLLLLLSEVDYCNLKIRLLLKPENEAAGEHSYFEFGLSSGVRGAVRWDGFPLDAALRD